jgi:hypothetical protein
MRSAFASPMKRTIRLLWVLATNVTFIYVAVKDLESPLGFWANWGEFLLAVITPFLGLVAELAGWRFARWINVGFFAAGALCYFAAAVYYRRDPSIRVFIASAAIFLVISVVTEVVYRRTQRATTVKS